MSSLPKIYKQEFSNIVPRTYQVTTYYGWFDSKSRIEEAETYDVISDDQMLSNVNEFISSRLKKEDIISINDHWRHGRGYVDGKHLIIIYYWG